jgi:alpha-1,3-rhamnosyl/mannosyltransferase
MRGGTVMRAGRGDDEALRVAYDGRPAAERRGVGRYARHLLEALRHVAPGEIVETHRPRGAAVYHSPWLDGALLRSPCPMVVTLHDLVPLKRWGEYLRTASRFRLRYLAVHRAVRVIVPTEAVAADAEEILGIERERLAVIPGAAPASLAPPPADEVAEVRARYGLPEHYLLWVGGLEHPDPRKRVSELARVERRLPLVLVGNPGRWAKELPDVTLTGDVSDHDLGAIYTGAHALTIPSEEEGFGLPAIEALACGTPVAACDAPGLRELLGDRATFVPCSDLAALVAAAESAEHPAPASPPWTWEDVAGATWDVYERAAATRGPAVPRGSSQPALRNLL